MGLIDDIKNQVKKSGSNKGKIVYFKSGVKVRIRFLQELDDGMKILFHDSFEAGVNVPCQEHYDRDCKHHEDESLRHREIYMWSVWDHEAKEVKILMGPVNNYSPIPALVGMYDTYGTIVDRDYVITKTGGGTDQTWSVVPMDKAKFKNDKAKPFSEAKVLSILDKAFPAGEEDEDEEDEDVPVKKKKKPAKEEPKKKSKAPVTDDDEDEDEAPKKKSKSKKKVNDYEDMTAKELYLECKDRGIECKPKKDEDYYIELLEEYDEDENDNDEDDDDSWD